MEKFNNTTLFTGYLKQLLTNFNLPKYKVYTEAQQKYFNDFGVEREDVYETHTKYILPLRDGSNFLYYPNNLYYVPYIRNGMIQEYVEGTWYNIGQKNDIKNTHRQYYDEGMKILNYTRNLKIQNNVYDSYTHEYLGDYLRFKRDFNGIDLMPLYNCFSDRPCDLLKLSFPIESKEVKFDTEDDNYKIYMLPVKLFKEYTIAIESELPIEICCGLYGEYFDDREKFVLLPQMTYMKVNDSKFSEPFLYSKLALSPKAQDIKNSLRDKHGNKIDCLLNSISSVSNVAVNFLDELRQSESTLKMFIKIPKNNKSTIVILEGNYCNWNNRIPVKIRRNNTSNIYSTQANKVALNFEKLPEEFPFALITPLQLLNLNTREQHPFSDRLIEYLLENAITSAETVSKNIARVQKALINNTKANPRSYMSQYREKVVPDNYTQLMCLCGKGQQYIDTGIKISSKVSVEIAFSFDDINNTESYVFGTDINPFYCTIGRLATGKFRAMNTNSLSYEADNVDTDVHAVKMSATKIIFDSIITNDTCTPYEDENNRNFFLFAANIGNSAAYYFTGRIYYCKMWEELENGELQLVRDFIPVKRNDGVLGLYDLVSNRLFTNIGSDSFIAGKKIEPKPYINPYNYMYQNKDLWDNAIQYIIYDYMNANLNQDFEVNHDILGYVDKDVEKYYQYQDADGNNISISGTYLDDEEEL